MPDEIQTPPEELTGTETAAAAADVAAQAAAQAAEAALAAAAAAQEQAEREAAELAEREAAEQAAREQALYDSVGSHGTAIGEIAEWKNQTTTTLETLATAQAALITQLETQATTLAQLGEQLTLLLSAAQAVTLPPAIANGAPQNVPPGNPQESTPSIQHEKQEHHEAPKGHNWI